MRTSHCTALYLPRLCVSATLYDQSPLSNDAILRLNDALMVANLPMYIGSDTTIPVKT